jgi:Dit-like phage tail protein
VSGLATGFAGVGFLANLLGSPSPQRAILLPATDSAGNPVTNASGGQVYQAVDGYVAVEESGRDEMIITDHPVEQGAVISDHAYRMPATLRMRLGWSAAMSGAGEVSVLGVTLPTLAGLFGAFDQSASGDAGQQFLQAIYAQLLTVLANRELLVILTGKSVYSNMLLRSLDLRTTQETENSLLLDCEFRQVILVNTSTVNVPQGMSANPANLANQPAATPTQNGGQQSLQPGSAYAGGAAP